MASGPFSVRALAHVVDKGAPAVRAKIVRLYAVLFALNAGASILAFAAFYRHPVLLGSAALAYAFGLRHAVDADHICAIDNVTRKLMQSRKTPVAVGFYFSLGHSTIVIALSAALAIGAGAVRTHLPELVGAGSAIGASVSAAFLLAIAAINTLVLAGIVRAFRHARRTRSCSETHVDELLSQRGLMGRFFGPLLRLADADWKMYPIGMLFGLGFDTATEIGLLGITAIQAGAGLPVYDILIFPLLFMAGMSLLDTTDGVLMLGAYGWAFVKPLRKLYYNAVITLVSVLLAGAVGAIEAAGVLASHLHRHGPVVDALTSLNAHFGTLGCAVVVLLLAGWGVSAAIYKIKRYDEIDVRAQPNVRV